MLRSTLVIACLEQVKCLQQFVVEKESPAPFFQIQGEGIPELIRLTGGCFNGGRIVPVEKMDVQCRSGEKHLELWKSEFGGGREALREGIEGGGVICLDNKSGRQLGLEVARPEKSSRRGKGRRVGRPKER